MTRRDVRSIAREGRRRATAAADALRGGGRGGRARPISAVDDPDAWWHLLPFTTHRIPLGGGFETASVGVDAMDDVRTDLVVDACGGSLDGLTVVDLGCLEGGFTLALAARGAAYAVGIEAREISVARSRLAAGLLGATNVEFVQADIKDELARRDAFDVVFAAGILYHVADPAALLSTIRASCRRVALVDTHVAHPSQPTHGCSDLVERTFGGSTYRGRMFPEYDAAATASEKSELLWAAWSDVDSFWPLEEDLVAMMEAAGFDSVQKVDLVADGRAARWGVDHLQRVVYVARVGDGTAADDGAVTS